MKEFNRLIVAMSTAMFLVCSLMIVTGPERLPDIENGVRLAVIGDFGKAGIPVIQVAKMVRSWNPEAVVTVGDNSYPSGSYRDLFFGIYPYYSWAIRSEKLVTTLGNHDWGYPWDEGWDSDEIPLLKALPYLPGNGRYYSVLFGDNLVEAFIIDTDPREPDGIEEDSTQGQWLKNGLSHSTATYQLIFMHVPPYSSCLFGDNSSVSWPFQEWGAEAVFAGHCHNYERVMKDGFPYFINGLGGHPGLTEFEEITDGSMVRYIDNFGAQLIEATQEKMTISFITIDGDTIDYYEIYSK
ncbi:MAG: Alkaline phosphatase [Candidatus Collierbacteria bacterium GW2011_GWC2_43_12]|uniref:Alkaline phosphatase n=1 Tax=Candidatus Collierbacteria bacterium GW2011_GWC2_43_12 TaxID=1618390 RepID=A0A0G1G0K6_9BACT|nr:MAG: Alkaline phosphatase [Candidatus Collierbacteria bacterium GW2011_GWC2_43_12]